MRPDSLESAHAALAAGHPRRAAQLFESSLEAGEAARLGLTAALLRLGDAAEAGHHLDLLPASARRAVLEARLAWLVGAADALERAARAHALARREGDTPALVAAVTLHGALLWWVGEPRAALHALAAGLNVSERAGEAADAHLLAVLARIQAEVGSPAKARRTAEKALARSDPGSPARVTALLALGRAAEAREEAEAGELADAYLS